MPVLEASEELELREEESDLGEGEDDEGGLDLHWIHLLSLEPEILERFSRTAVELRRLTVVTALGGKIAFRDPSSRSMAGRGELLEARLGPVEHLCGLLEPILLEERAAEDELRVPDLVDELDAVSEELERVTRLLFGEDGLIGAKVNLGE